MKSILNLLILLLLSITANAQIPNLTGEWNGKGLPIGGGNNFTMQLKITLLDSCGPIYRVSQSTSGDNDVVSYNMIQSKNIIVRDVVDSWEGNGFAAHLTLKYIDGRLEGLRVRGDNLSEKLTLSRVGPAKSFKPCFKEIVYKTKYKTVYKSDTTSAVKSDEPCKIMTKVDLPDDVFAIREGSSIVIDVTDNAESDSDRVTIFVNKQKILNDVMIYPFYPYSIPLLINKVTFVTWCACNQGTSGENTGKFILKEYFKGELIQEKSVDINLQKNQQTSILIYVKTNTQ